MAVTDSRVFNFLRVPRSPLVSWTLHNCFICESCCAWLEAIDPLSFEFDLYTQLSLPCSMQELSVSTTWIWHAPSSSTPRNHHYLFHKCCGRTAPASPIAPLHPSTPLTLGKTSHSADLTATAVASKKLPLQHQSQYLKFLPLLPEVETPAVLDRTLWVSSPLQGAMLGAHWPWEMWGVMHHWESCLVVGMY
jgi:hypothetical protein